MHELVLVTTGESLVRSYLSDRVPSIAVVDCACGREMVMARLADLVMEGTEVLLTYRCPYIIPENLYACASYGAFNIHPSLLPAYPGLNPWGKILEDGLRESGVTLHRICSIPDAGEILAQEIFEMTPADTLMSAREKADAAAVKLLINLRNG